MSNPCGTTQSVQYRRVVRVERKTVDNPNVRPVVYPNVGAVPVVYGVSLPSVPPTTVPAIQYGPVTYVQKPQQQAVSSRQRVVQSKRASAQMSAPHGVAQSSQFAYTSVPSLPSVQGNDRQFVQGANCHSAQDVNGHSTQGVNQQFVQQFSRQSIQRTNQQSVRPSTQPIRESNQQSIQRPLPQRTLQQPVQSKSSCAVSQNCQPVVQPKSQQPSQSPQRCVQQYVRQSSQQFVEHSAQQPARQPVNRSMNQSMNRSVNQPVQQPVQQPVNQPVNQPVQLPVRQPVNPPIQHPTQQPLRKPSQPSIQPKNQPVQPLPSHPVNPSQTTHPAPSQPRQSPTGTVEELKPGSLSDRIKMFEAKTCAAPVIPMPETRTYDESAGEDTFVPSVEVPKPVSIAQRKAQLEKQVSQNPSPSKPAIPCKQQQVPQPPQRANQSVQPQQAQTKPPGKLSIPSSVPGQLSLEEMLQKKLAQGARQPPVASSDPVSQPSLPNRPSPAEPAMSYKKSQSTYQESQLAKQSLPQPLPPVQPFSSQLAQSTKSSHQEELQQPQRPQPHHALVIPPPVPGQLSLEEMLQKKQSHIVTTMHEEYQESTQSTTVNYVTPQPPSTQPPVEPSRPVITFTDRALQDSTNECLFTTSGVLLAILTKEDVKKVFASDAPLAISGTSDAIVCIYKDQTCVYHYSPESKDYQLLVGSSIPMHPRYL